MNSPSPNPHRTIDQLERASALGRRGDLIYFWGRGMEYLYGITSQEAVGEDVGRLLNTRYLQPEDFIRRRFEADGYWHGTLERKTKNGEIRLIESQWIRLPASGTGTVDVLEIDVDVTAILEHRQFEGRLIEQAEALWKSNRELEQFAYICSHDLREPLRKISNFAQLLESKHGADLKGEARHYLDVISEGAQRMANLVTGLMDYSRLDRSKQGGSINLNDIVQCILDDLEPALSAVRGTVRVEELGTVRANPDQMRQLFQNLMQNAVKFHDPTRNLELTIRKELCEGALTYLVRDNGIGIEAMYREQIFKVFQRLHSASRYSGTGIGLAICKKIVEGYGGRIWLESEPGQGTTFYFTLPSSSDDSKPSG